MIFLTFHDRCSWRALALALGVLWIFAMPAWGAVQPQDIQSVLEDRAQQLLSPKIDPKLFIVYVKFNAPANASKQAKRSKIIALPFSPVGVNSDILEDSKKEAQDFNVRDYRFSIALIFDTSISDPITETFRGVFTERFMIDGQNRILVLKKQKINEQDKTNNFEKTKLEADISLSRLETERQRLESTKNEIEYKKKIFEAEKALQDEKSARTAEFAKNEQVLRDLKAKQEAPPKAQEPPPKDKTEKLPNTEPAKSPLLQRLGEFQMLVIGILAFISLLIAVTIFSRALKKSMGAVGDGIKAAGSGIGAAMTPSPSNNPGSTENPILKMTGENSPPAQEAPTSEEKLAWTPGNPEYDKFIQMVQEKIEILNAMGSLVLHQQVSDLLETESGIEIAASVVLSLKPESAHSLIANIPSEAVRKLKAFLESPSAIARSKMKRSEALQLFYGKIAGSEFTDSPMGKLRNLTWLTKMNNTELVKFTLGLTDTERPAFLACLSPFRLAKIIEAASAEDRPKFFDMIGRIGKLTENDVNTFLTTRQKKSDLEEKSEKARPAVDHLLYISEVAEHLSPSDQKALLKAVESDQAATSFLSRRFLPFVAVRACPAEILTLLFERWSVVQIAQIVFSADKDTQNLVISSLPKIRAQGVVDELTVLQSKTHLEQRNRQVSERLQREITTYMLQLADEGMLNLDSLVEFSTKTGAPVPLSKLGSSKGAA